VGEV
jgi:hypothetical protein